MRVKWSRIEDGYASGNARVYDNGAGVGPSAGSGRWAVVIGGKWVANVDTLGAAKALVATLINPVPGG